VGSALLSTFPQPIWILKVQQRQAIRSRLGYTQRIYRNKVAQSFSSSRSNLQKTVYTNCLVWGNGSLAVSNRLVANHHNTLPRANQPPSLRRSWKIEHPRDTFDVRIANSCVHNASVYNRVVGLEIKRCTNEKKNTGKIARTIHRG
jgi:hypothetical protein